MFDVQADPDAQWRAALFENLWENQSDPQAFAHPGWRVYRNTTLRACHEGLRANFPALAVLLGGQAFDVLARAYRARHRPRDARLLHYGDDLPEFLAQFTPAAPWPHLVDIARLDRAWIEAHCAAEAPHLTAQQVSQDPASFASCVCVPHPAARWHWSDHHPVASLWIGARQGKTQSENLPWQPEGLLLTRMAGEVRWSPLSRAEATFMQACAAQHNLTEAMGAAMASDPDVNLSHLISHLLTQGALMCATP